MNRKQEVIHRDHCCYWSLFSVHSVRLKPHSEWEVGYTILRETHTLNSACVLTISIRLGRQLNYYGAQTLVTKRKQQMEHILSQLCSLRLEHLCCTYGGCHSEDFCELLPLNFEIYLVFIDSTVFVKSDTDLRRR